MQDSLFESFLHHTKSYYLRGGKEMKKVSKILVLFLSIIMIATTILGCSKKVVTKDTKDPKGQTALTKIPLPIVTTPITLSIFWDMDAKALASMKSYAEIGFFKEMEKRTGIKIDWRHPATGQATEQFNLMIASKDMPDMIWWNWRDINGGPAKAIADGNIVKLNDLMSKYSPNINKVFADNPEWKKQAVLDDGTFYTYPFIREDKSLRLSSAFQIRQDWLDKLKLKAPTSIDEWYDVLTAFKKQDPNGNGKNDEIPFVTIATGSTFGLTTPTIRSFEFAYGIVHGFYNDASGKVQYGPTQVAYKDYLTTMNKWFKEGLIDPEYLATDAKSFDAKITTNIAGSYFGMVSGNMGRFSDLVKPEQPTFQLAGVPFPMGPAGKTYGTLDNSTQSSGVAITTTNKHPIESAQWLDYFYSPEGKMLVNFGVKDVSYTMVNGEPKFSDIVLKNPDKLSVPNALIRQALSISGGPFVQDKRYMPQILLYPEQTKAVDTWIKSSDPSLLLPPITPTAEESKKLAGYMSDINTYTDEMFNKFIMGTEPIANFDKYVQKVKDLNIDEAIKIEQAALGRYNARK